MITKKMQKHLLVDPVDRHSVNQEGDNIVAGFFHANFPGFYNSMSKKPTITAFFEV
ncbi:hypothetical protein [Lactobacillus delbrueckii]|uniref:hypothetical protein n=1 Tax=Lactobacillus delbrueckii TaxID=1584 RepID=UPI0022DFB6BF|nr:hypothetical protein [Lactobacillus delbrueckii]